MLPRTLRAIVLATVAISAYVVCVTPLLAASTPCNGTMFWDGTTTDGAGNPLWVFVCNINTECADVGAHCIKVTAVFPSSSTDYCQCWDSTTQTISNPWSIENGTLPCQGTLAHTVLGTFFDCRTVACNTTPGCEPSEIKPDPYEPSGFMKDCECN